LTRATPGSAPSNPASHLSFCNDRFVRSAPKETVTGSHGVGAALPGADPYHGLHRHRPDLAVADAAALRGLHHDADQVFGVLVVTEDLDAHLRHEIDLVLGAAVHLGVAALPAVPARLRDGHAVHAERLKRGLDVVELEGLDDRRDKPHVA